MDASALIPHEPYSEGNLELTSFTKHFQQILTTFSIYQAYVCQSPLSFHPTYHQMVIKWQSLPELPEHAPQASLHGPRAWMDTWEPSAGHVNYFLKKKIKHGTIFLWRSVAGVEVKHTLCEILRDTSTGWWRTIPSGPSSSCSLCWVERCIDHAHKFNHLLTPRPNQHLQTVSK